MENTSVPDYRLFQLEQIAEEALKNAQDCISGSRVNIERLIESKYGFQIEAFQGLRSKYDTLGFVMAHEKKVYIDASLMDDDDQERRYRFTLAEELAHFLIHQNFYHDCTTIEARILKDRETPEETLDRMEQQAKALAAALLMPRSTFDPLVDSLASQMMEQQGGIDIRALVRRLQSEYDVSNRPVIYRMKHRGLDKKLGLNDL